MSDTTTIPSAYPDAYPPQAIEQWRAARAAHAMTLEDSMKWECYDGGCTHGNEVECPTIQVAVCSHCYGLVMEDGRETAPSSVVWPCDTAKALGAVAS